MNFSKYTTIIYQIQADKMVLIVLPLRYKRRGIL